MGQATPKSRTVEANEFIMKDDARRVQAKLHMDHGGPRRSLYDASGVETTILMRGGGGGAGHETGPKVPLAY
jgi:hypothetical protein